MQSPENIRSESGKGTIPTYSTISGLFNTDGTVKDIIRYTGTIKAVDVFGPDLQEALRNNLYVYQEVANPINSVKRIVSVITSDKNSTTWAVLIESPFQSDLSSEPVKIVVADLNEFGVVNDGGSDGSIDGVLFKAGDSIELSEDSRRRWATRNRVARAFNATGTSFLITELK